MIKTKDAYANAVYGKDDQALQDIHLASKNIAIYQRNISSLSEELRPVTEQGIECGASGTTDEILSKLSSYLNHTLSESSALFEDISKLLSLFEGITKASSFRLLLKTVSTDMCRKFHTDINDLRLLCTYVGPGTLWVPDDAVNPKALQSRKNNLEMVLDQQQIQQVSTGDVVILKGALYPEANPILHRSPAIKEQGEKRLLLRIDTNQFLNF